MLFWGLTVYTWGIIGYFSLRAIVSYIVLIAAVGEK